MSSTQLAALQLLGVSVEYSLHLGSKLVDSLDTVVGSVSKFAGAESPS